jgi:hypothetical protein
MERRAGARRYEGFVRRSSNGLFARTGILWI